MSTPYPGNISNTTESEVEWRTEFHTTLIVLAVLIFIVNFPVVFLYFKISTLRHSAGNTFLVGLAIADIICACVMIPIGVLGDSKVLSGDHHKNLVIFYWACALTVSVATVYHIVAATVAKYFAIVHPMRNITACTHTRVCFVVASIWIVSILVGHVPLYILKLDEKKVAQLISSHGIFLIVFAFAIPALILTCIHLHIYARLFLKSRTRALINEANTRSENNRRIAIMFSLLFLFFVISWLPYYLVWPGWIQVDQGMLDLVAVIRFLAPVVNPVMFTFAKRDFRKAALSLVGRLRGGERDQSSRRYITATSSVDRTNFIEQPNLSKADNLDADDISVVHEREALQTI